MAPDRRRFRTHRWWPVLGGLVALVSLSSCARPARPTPTISIPRYPDYMSPAVPPDLQQARAVVPHQQAWEHLQTGDLRAAERSFSAALKTTPGFYPSEAGLGYVKLVQQDFPAALEEFDRALVRAPTYVPALLGRGEALLASGREREALESFEAALAVDPSLADIRRRAAVLRFQNVGQDIARAQSAHQAGRYEEARDAYERAIQASPESAFLYRELADVERRTDDLDRALEHAQKAVDVDPNDTRSLVLLGEVHEARQELEPALRAYTGAKTLDPSVSLDERIATLRERLALSKLPAEFNAIAGAATVSRAELAALIGVRLESFLERAPRRGAALITDTRGHWASPWIITVAGAGVMEVYPNHTFQPNAPIRRGDLAQAVSRVLNLIATQDPPRARQWAGARPRFADLPPGHLTYPAASLAVAAGVLPLLDGETFQLTRPVSGAEAIAVIERLESVAEGAAR